MTNQEIFNKAYIHLLTQNIRTDNFAYRTIDSNGNTLMCAIGCLIDDSAYDPSIEYSNVYCKGVKRALNKSGIPTDDSTMDLLSLLQGIHDTVSPELWPDQLYKLSIHQGLTIPKMSNQIESTK